MRKKSGEECSRIQKGFMSVLFAAALVVSTGTCTYAASGSSTAVLMDGEVTGNYSNNNYSVSAAVVDSYLMENEDGTLTRVEYLGDEGVLVETYTSDYTLLSNQTIEAELSIFGGFYAGEDYNYLVYGQKNPNESDAVEVIRIVKYDKNWNRVDVCSIYGANTYVPFNAGSTRMTEANGLLYLYSCHTMYAESDGVHHQANMTFVVDEDSMEVTQSYYDIMNISYGYVSHSFNQYIQTDGTYVYRVDHGDAYPRAVSITKCSVNGKITSVSYTLPLKICGTTGANATGVSVGGLELSSENCLIVGNSVDQSDSSAYSASGQRNIFLTVTDQSLKSTEVIWLTDYTSDDGITPRTPQIVAAGDDSFLIMWEEYHSDDASVTVQAVTVDGDGNQTSDIVSMNARLSDCQPIVTSDGLVRWYVSNGVKVAGYAIDPENLDAVGDLDVLSTDMADCTVTLEATSYEYTGSTIEASVTVKYGNTTLVQGKDYTVTYSNNTDPGTATVTIAGKGNVYYGTKTISFTITKGNLTKNGDEYLIEDLFYYDGTAHKPEPTVYFGRTKLIKGTDYTLSYKNNVNAGTGTVVITGTGKYTGTLTAEFTIEKAGIGYCYGSPYGNVMTKGSTCSMEACWWDVSGNARTDCISYSSSNSSVASVSSSGVITAKQAGTTTITIDFKGENGNYYEDIVSFKVTVNLTAPKLSTLTNTSSGVKISWSKVSGAAKYQIWRKTASGSWSKLGTTTSTSYTDKTAKSGTNYYYRVRCVKSDGTTSQSSYSNSKCIKRLAASKITSLTNTSSGIKVQWNKVTGANGYFVYRLTSSGSTSYVKNITSGSTLSWTDTSIKNKNGTTYRYYVMPYFKNSGGIYTFGPDSAKKTTVRMTAVSISSLKNSSSKQMTVKWAKNSSAAGYQIQYSTSSSFASGNKTVTVSGASSVSKMISSLTKGKTYYVRVRAYKTVSGTKYYSAWSSKKSVKISK